MVEQCVRPHSFILEPISTDHFITLTSVITVMSVCSVNYSIQTASPPLPACYVLVPCAAALLFNSLLKVAIAHIGEKVIFGNF